MSNVTEIMTFVTIELRLGAHDSAEAAHPERAAFADALATQQHRVATLVRRLLGWPGDANEIEDVVQEVFLAAWQHRDQFRGQAQWSTWLTAIALRKTRNHVRARDRRHRLLTLLGLGPGAEPAAPVPAAAHGNDADSHLHAAMARLRHADRELLVLRYLEKKAIETIAAQLGLRRNTVDARLTRARNRLRAVLKPEANGA